MIKDGFLKKFTDHRDLSLIPSFGGTDDTNGLPAEYVVATKDMPSQNDVGLPFACTAFAQTELASDQTGEIYDVEEFYRATPPGDNGGRDMRTSMSLLVNRGPKTLEQKLRPWNGKYYNIYRYGALDWFDACRVGLYLVKDEKRAASAGVAWFKPWVGASVPTSGIVQDPEVYSWSLATAHDAVIAGWVTKGIGHGQPLGGTYLAVKSWQGKHIGDAGWLYFSRPIINKLFDMYYTDMFTASQQKPSTFATVDLPAIERVISYIRNLFRV